MSALQGTELRPSTFMRSAMLAALAAAASGAVIALTGSPLFLVGAVALAIGVVLFLAPALGTPTFLALLWINAPAVLVAFHGMPGIIGEATLLLLAFPVATYLLRRGPIIATPTLVALVAFVAANMLSAAMSTNARLATESVTSLIGEGLVIYLLVSNAIRSVTVARWSIAAIVMASVIMAGLAIHQEVTESYDDPYLGFAQNGLQAEPGGAAGNADRLARMEGPVGEVNRFAQILLVALPLAIFGLRGVAGRGAGWLGLGAGLVIVAGVFLTFSRGAAVALVILAVIMVVRKHVPLRQVLAITAVFILTIALIAPQFFTRVESLTALTGLVSGGGEEPDGAIVGRTTSTIASLLVFADHPIAGVGPGVFPSGYSLEYGNRLGLRFREEERRAHNMYLEWAAELGLIGLTAGVAMIATTLVQLSGLRKFWQGRRGDLANMAGAMSLAVIAYSVTGLFLHLAYARYFFALLALANAVIWVLQRERDAVRRRDPEVPAGSREALAS